MRVIRFRDSYLYFLGRGIGFGIIGLVVRVRSLRLYYNFIFYLLTYMRIYSFCVLVNYIYLIFIYSFRFRGRGKFLV